MSEMEIYYAKTRELTSSVIECETAHQLINALDLTQAGWAINHRDGKEQWERGWVFRGQRDYEWGLLPSAWRNLNNVENPNILLKSNTWRDGVSLKFRALDFLNRPNLSTKIYKQVDAENNTEKYSHRLAEVLCQAYIEVSAIGHFARKADELGIPMPSYNDFWGQLVKEVEPYDGNFFSFYLDMMEKKRSPSLWKHPLVALAQHHGIPTRLVDWTQNPLLAAFFAAEDYKYVDTENDNREKHMAVYAIELKRHIHLERITADYSNNSFLKAQRGLFTYDSRSDMFYLQQGRYPDISDSIDNKIDSVNGDKEFWAGLNPKVFVLPPSEVPELLRLLALLGITKASLMPTFDNVAKSVKLQWELRYDRRV